MDKTPTHLDLFSGIGGFSIAARWAGFRTIGFCEIDKYCQRVLAKNFGAVVADTTRNGRREVWTRQPTASGETMADAASEGANGHSIGKVATHAMPGISSNIFDLDGRDFANVSLITGGFPCQPFSVAGKRGGAADDRAIWPEMFRVINEARPAWVLGENVPGLIPMELDNVLSDLEGIGYATRTFVIPACAVDARHRRDRLWIIGRNLPHATSTGLEGQQRTQPEGTGNGLTYVRESSSNSMQQGLERQREQPCGTGPQLDDTGDHCRWESEPDVGRVANGIPKRVDRLKGLGNAIVPQVAYELLREIRKQISP